MRYSAILALSASLLASPALAEVEWDISGFGTLGAVISDSYAHYQREIDDGGTLLRDSLVGGQVDVKFNDKWSATAQVMLAAATDEDDQLAPQLKWTLVSYRPSNDWLIRAGRMSLGGLLNQQNMDVGVSYDMLRLPNEVYAVSQLYDFDGLSVAKTWNTTDYEITLDVSGGFQTRDYRSYRAGSDEPFFYEADIWGSGLVLTVTDYDQKTLRLGWHYNRVKPDAPGFLDKLNFVPLGDGRYTFSPATYEDTANFNTLFLGLRFPLQEFMVTMELTYVDSGGSDIAPPNLSGYLNVARKFGNWTPYVTYAQMYSFDDDPLNKVRGATPMPIPGLTQSDIDNLYTSIAYYDQQSVMLGTSYAFTPKQKLKGEIMFTHVGDRSAMFDELIENEIVSVYSLAYCFMF
ncbi:MAG: hypothetical protein LBU39_09835 [Desulfobulbaceae bacterium]|jgi:hypothetical protein|nr:hypothetical protein [Desulfobulbaceae bacterium]